MRKTVFLIFAFFILLAYHSSASVFDNLSNEIISHLHIVKGKVIAVKGKTVILNKGEKDGLIRNYFVYIYRNLGSFVPLNSSKPVKIKEGIAYANIVKVFEHKAVAVLTQGVEKEKKYLIGLGIIPNGEKELMGKPKPGDDFTAGKSSYTVAIITRNPYIYQALKSTLQKSGKFFVIGEDRVQIAIVNNRINSLYENTAIKKLANALDADLVIEVSPTDRLKKLRYKLFDGYSGNVILAGALPIDKQTRIVLNSQPIQTIPPENMVASNLRLQPRLTFWESILNKLGLYSPYTGLNMSSKSYKVVYYKPIGYGTTAFYYGKLTENGGDVIAVAKGSEVSVYRFEWNSFKKLYSFSFGYNIVSIDSAKVNGKLLVAISNFNRYGYLSSAVGYIQNHRFIPIKKGLKYHLRFFDKFSSHPILLAQRASISSAFYGPIYKMNLSTFKVSRFILPVKPANFYEFFKVGNKLVFINGSKQLEVYNLKEGKVIRTTSYGFGGGIRLIQRYPFNINTKEQEPIEELYRKASVKIPKVLTLQRIDNTTYILGFTNYMSNHITVGNQAYNAYNIKMFELKNNNLRLVWSSGDVKGRMVGCARDGDYIVSVIGVPTGFFDRFIRGISETDRLTAARIEY